MVLQNEKNRENTCKYRRRLKENGQVEYENPGGAEFTEMTNYVCIDCEGEIRHYYDMDRYLGRVYRFKNRFRCKSCYFFLNISKKVDVDMTEGYGIPFVIIGEEIVADMEINVFGD